MGIPHAPKSVDDIDTALFARFVEQELKAHENFESDCDTMKRQREKENQILVEGARTLLDEQRMRKPKDKKVCKKVEIPKVPNNFGSSDQITKVEDETNKTQTAQMVPDPVQTMAHTAADEDATEELNQSSPDTDNKSAMIRGKPKLTKTTPPVVAIKMADLMDGTSEIDKGNEEGQTFEKSKATNPPVEDKKLRKQLEKKERREKERIEKEMKLKEKKNKADQLKLKKEEEKMKKIQEKQVKNEQLKVKVENELNKDMVPVRTALEDNEELQTFENKEANNQ